MVPICWLLNKFDRVAKNSLASETFVFSDAAAAGVLIAAMLQEIFRLLRLPEVLYETDNASLVGTLKSSNFMSDQHLRVDVARMKEMLVKEEIHSEWIWGTEQVIVLTN